MIEFVLSMTILEKIFLTCALSGSVIFFMRMLLLFVGFAGHGGDAVDSLDGDMPDDVSIDSAMEVHNDLALHGADIDNYSVNSNADVSFHFISVQGLTAFFMMFGWVGLAMVRDSMLPGWIAVLSGMAAGSFTVWVLAQIFRFMASLQSDGTVRISKAMGKGGSVYLRIPAEGSGQVQVEVDGRLRIYDAVSSKKEEIKTGEQVTVVWVQDNGILVVEKDTRDEGGRLCGL